MSNLIRYNTRNFWPTTFNSNIFDSYLRPNRNLTDRGRGSLYAPVDLSEKDESYFLKIDVPGIKKEDIDMSVKNGVLTVSGERKHENSEADESCSCSELRYGTFSRSFRLGNGIDPDAIKAKLEDGVLEVTLSKKPEIKPKQIEVN